MDNQSPDKGLRQVAFIDIGTNSIRLLLVRIHPNDSYTILSQQKEVVRLGEDEFIEKKLRPQAMQRAAVAVQRFAELARSRQADEIVAVATSATREAENRAEFVQLLRDQAGVDVHTISGKEEARLIYLGVSRGVHLGNSLALFIDIGGGSTELIIGGQYQYQALESHQLGAIRLTSLFFLPDEDGPVDPIRYDVIRNFVRNEIVRSRQELEHYAPQKAIGSSGTILNLAEVAAQYIHGTKFERDSSLSYQDLTATIRMMCTLSLEERRDLPGINPERADIIIAGSAILDTVMEEMGITHLRVSERGLQDGLLVDYLERRGLAAGMSELPVRERSALQLGRRLNFEESHATSVRRLALELFDSAQETGLHELGGWERDLLAHAALLHDVGSFISFDNHEDHSFYVIRNSDLVGFDQTEIDILACTALFHKKGLPTKKQPVYAELDEDYQEAVKILSMLLRLAESLDRSHLNLVQSAQFGPNGKKQVQLNISSSQPVRLEAWGVENDAEAFKKTFKKRLEVILKKTNSHLVP